MRAGVQKAGGGSSPEKKLWLGLCSGSTIDDLTGNDWRLASVCAAGLMGKGTGVDVSGGGKAMGTIRS